jgi:hypothetical protein
MANRNKFEEMLERLINEDRDGAEELFHEIVVEKSRKIYEGLLESDLEDEDLDEMEAKDKNADGEDEGEVGDATGGKRTGVKGPKQLAQDPKEGGKTKAVKEDEDEEVDESDDDDLEEEFDLDEFEVEADPMMGGDPADDMMGDIAMGGDDMEMGGDDEGDMEDRVEDLEDALDELKAEFEKLMAGDEGGDDEGDMDMDMDMGDEEGEDDGDDEEAEEESYAYESDDEEVEEKATAKSDAEQMREYVEKVNGGFGAKIGGDNGQNTKSPVAKPNNMGGNARNLAQGGEEKGGNNVGLGDKSAKEDNAGNVNVPGGKAGKSMKSMPKGHGAEKKGQGENAANKKSLIGGK